MKKLLVSIFLILGFVGCGGGDDDSSSTKHSWGTNLDFYVIALKDFHDFTDVYGNLESLDLMFDDNELSMNQYIDDQYSSSDNPSSYSVNYISSNIVEITTQYDNVDAYHNIVLTATSDDSGDYSFKAYVSGELTKDKEGKFEIGVNGKNTQEYIAKYGSSSNSDSGSSSSSGSYTGTYVGNATNYTDTITLNSGGSGKRKHVHDTTNTYDYNINISWEYDSSSNKIVTTDEQSSPTGSIGNKHYYSISNGNLTLDGGVGIIFYKQ